MHKDYYITYHPSTYNLMDISCNNEFSPFHLISYLTNLNGFELSAGNYIDYLETIEGEILGTEPDELEETIEIIEEVPIVNENLKIKGELDVQDEFNELQKILNKNTKVIEKSMKIVSNIQIPKIYLPKIKVHIPGINKNKNED